MQTFLNQDGHVARSLLLVLIGLIVPAVLMIVIYTDQDAPERQKRTNPQIQAKPRIGEMLPAEKLGGERLELFRLPGPLGQTPIHALLATDRVLWLGTDLGLIRFEPGGTSKLYRNFAHATRESIQTLALANGKIAAAITVTNGDAPSTPVGSFLFDPATETWQRIGIYVHSLASDNSRLWGLSSRSLINFSEQSDGRWRQQELATEHQLCSTGQLAFANEHLWLVQTGSPMRPDSNQLTQALAKEIPCGVLRLDPATGAEMFYTTGQGLGSESGRAIAGDERETWIAHHVAAGGLSYYARDQQRWFALPMSSNDYPLAANRIGISDRAIWLGTDIEEWPLLRLDRESHTAGSITEAPAGYQVSAIASYPGSVWVALSKKTPLDKRGDEQIDTVLGRLRE